MTNLVKKRKVLLIEKQSLLIKRMEINRILRRVDKELQSLDHFLITDK